ncbi:UNVERIFIED_CONTAM: hypothetical protein FKN15_039875 [Acipenser sinensis]
MLNSLGHGAENKFSLVVSSKGKRGSCIFERLNVFVQQETVVVKVLPMEQKTNFPL